MCFYLRKAFFNEMTYPGFLLLDLVSSKFCLSAEIKVGE